MMIAVAEWRARRRVWVILCAIRAAALECEHGNQTSDLARGQSRYSTTRCDCDAGWAGAGPSDTLAFLRGACTQYMCSSAERCREATGVKVATCPVADWNCLCPFEYSLRSSLQGYETKRDANGSGHGGRCMGVLYWTSVQGSAATRVLLMHGWKLGLASAALLSPLGQRRTRCTHHTLGIVNAFLMVASPPCPGDCINRASKLDEFAWSMWALELCTWVHVLILMTWATCVYIGAFMLGLTAALLLFLVVSSAYLFMWCMWDAPHCVDYSDVVHDCTRSSGRGRGRLCTLLARCFAPLALTVLTMPAVPENMLGGCLGRCLGTHATSRTWMWRELAQSHWYRLLSFQWCRWNAHADLGWRHHVWNFVHHAPLPTGERAENMVIFQDIPFDEDRQECAPNTYNDYVMGNCWICCSSQSFFDLYSCGHIFCCRCSNIMLQRRMTCPLCRRAPLWVSRGPTPRAYSV